MLRFYGTEGGEFKASLLAGERFSREVFQIPTKSKVIQSEGN
jgi:hypothetical protein